MGYTGLARWSNAPTHGLSLIHDNIVNNHNGHLVGRWHLSVRSYRSILGQISGISLPSERTMCALTMDDNVFVLVEDPVAPTRADVVAPPPGSSSNAYYSHRPSHLRNTFLTLSPPGALEQLLAHLKARWTSIRQSTGTAPARAMSGQQLVVDGHIYKIGSDWKLRVGNVILAGGAVKGMLLEAEYLPLPVLHSPVADGTSELLSNLLTSMLPNIPEAKTVAVTISDSQWEDVLWDREEDTAQEENDKMVEDKKDEIFAYGHEDVPAIKKGDWASVDRDRRSAFLIMGALRSEGIL